jgi:ribose-phosphate pyrophosphokinase
LQIHYFADDAKLASRLANLTSCRAFPMEIKHFPDGESLVTTHSPVRDDVAIIHSLDRPDQKLIHLTLAADALRRAGAAAVTLVAPYLAYMRQDALFKAGQPISQRAIGRLLGSLFDRVLTVEAHLHRVKSLNEVVPSRLESRSLSAAPMIADWLRKKAANSLLLGPDQESSRWIEEIGARSGMKNTVGIKHRLSDRKVRVKIESVHGLTRAVIVDDIASSGATLAETAHALRNKGIRDLSAVIIHPIFAVGALSRIRRAGVETIVSCDTVAHPTNRIRVAPLLAAALSDQP